MDRINIIGASAAAAAGAGSLGLMLSAGRNTPVILLLLFTGWVFLPFAALFLANIYANGLKVVSNRTLSLTALLISLCSMAIYIYIMIWPSELKPAFTWLVVPGASWLIIISVAAASLFTHRADRRRKPAR